MDHTNIVLFPHALAIEGAEEELKREVSSVRRYSSDPDGPPDLTMHVEFAAISEQEKHQEPKKPELDFDSLNWISSIVGDSAPTIVSERSLRFILEGLEHRTVESIRVHAPPGDVNFYEEKDLAF